MAEKIIMTVRYQKILFFFEFLRKIQILIKDEQFESGHYFKFSCLATLILLFNHKKSIKIKGNGQKYKKTN
jgi:hypothetical protein